METLMQLDRSKGLNKSIRDNRKPYLAIYLGLYLLWDEAMLELHIWDNHSSNKSVIAVANNRNLYCN